MKHALSHKQNASAKAMNVSLVGAASARGSADDGCRFGPDSLRSWGLEAALCSRRIAAHWVDTLREPGVADRLSALEATGAFNERLAVVVQRIVSGGERFAVFGGDHTCAIGTWRGAARAAGHARPPGLIWIDAHMDSHTPETSPSGALHGMPLACLLGEGPHRLRAIPGPLLDPATVSLVGVRSYEPGESALIEKLGVRVFFMEEIHRRGLQAVLAEAVERAQSDGAPFGVSIDLDVLDPREAPGVSCPVEDGLGLDDLVDALRKCVAVHRPLGVEIAEFNPQRDRANATAHAIGRLAGACFASPTRRRKGRRWPPVVAARGGP